MSRLKGSEDMDLWQETNWFAVQAKRHKESLAAARIEALDLDVFLPKLQRNQQVGGIPRLVVKPLFPGYFFARFCPLISFEAVLRASGVLRILGAGRFPLPVESDVITIIRQRVQADGFVRLERRTLQRGEKVTIEQGPLAGWMGQVEREWDDGKRVLILLEVIQQARLLIDRRWLVATADLV